MCALEATGDGYRPGAAIPPSGRGLVNNVPVPVHSALSGRRPAVSTLTTLLTALGVAAAGLLLAGCGSDHPPSLVPNSPSAVPTGPTGAANQLAGLAAAALDRRYVAGYTYHSGGRADRIVVVSMATDGSWSVNVPGGALSGGANISMIGIPKAVPGTAAGTYQCVLGGPATTSASAPPSAPPPPVSPPPSGSPSPTPTGPVYLAPACDRVAGPGKDVPTKDDPGVEHVFTDWLSVLSSRNAPISVSAASPLSGTAGSCFSVEPSAASLAPVVDAGIFCFRQDGTMTAVRLASGTLTLSGDQAAPAPSTLLPAPASHGSAVPIKAPAALG